MQLNPLTAISPIDGRYYETVKPLAPYFSEFGLMRYRVMVEIEYLIALSGQLHDLEDFPIHRINDLRKIYKNFTEFHAEDIKAFEKTTNHDVKAVEYFVKKELEKLNLTEFREFIHLGLTSQDINNTAIPLLLKEFIEKEFLVLLEMLVVKLHVLAKDWKDIPMLAFTHGQPASPTRVGKEFLVFAARLERQIIQLKNVPHSAKFGGATGNFNAHTVAFPGTDWHKFADDFCNHLGLSRSFPTTQIEHYDNLAAMFDALKRINTIMIDFSRDIWAYISMGYFSQKIKAGEVGSSAMPHKVNPIDFENAEGNLGYANAIYEFMAGKLPISRLQRDLTDSTVLRNIGVPMAHSYLAIQSLLKGLGKLELNVKVIEADLNDNWAVISEAIQTILRRERFPNPYEALKELTRTNAKITRESLHAFIDDLKISDKVKSELKAITPQNYTGV